MTTTMTGVTITTPKSDDMIQREFLLKELAAFDSWRDQTPSRLRKLFNIDAPKAPETAEALIAAITGGKFTYDEKRLARMKERAAELIDDGDYEDADEAYACISNGPFDGIIFTDMPQRDPKGFDAAMAEWSRAKEAARIKLMILPPADGLDLLLALKEWTPTGKAS